MFAGCAVNPSGASRHSMFYAEDTDNVRNSASSSRSSGACNSRYRIRSGDTLSGIAVKCSVDMELLAKVNHLEPPYPLTAGQHLSIPSGAISVKNQPEASDENLAEPEMPDWFWPMDKSVPFTFNRDVAGHHALIFSPKIGQSVYAVDAGRVAYAGDDLPHYGNMVVIKHENGYVTVYAYNHRLTVTKDQQVKRGQMIALAGQSGDASQPQLYFEARYLGRKVDVKRLIKAP